MVKKLVDNYVYDLAEVLGKGAFGTVYKGSVYKSDQKVAVKVLNKKLGKISFLFQLIKISTKNNQCNYK